jgi:hypothetical protein
LFQELPLRNQRPYPEVHNSMELFDQGQTVLIELLLFDGHRVSWSADVNRPLLAIQI